PGYAEDPLREDHAARGGRHLELHGPGRHQHPGEPRNRGCGTQAGAVGEGRARGSPQGALGAGAARNQVFRADGVAGVSRETRVDGAKATYRMLEVEVPGLACFRLEHLVLDVNGTLALDGKLVAGIAQRLES